MKQTILLVVLFAFISCNNEINPGKYIIAYGTSFGMCVGYCITETNISKNKISVIRRTWNDDKEILRNVASISDEKISEILGGIAFEKFDELPETIGCPDCADGGSEWLEISHEGELKKVTFEYGDDIDGISEAVDALRKLTNELAPEVK